MRLKKSYKNMKKDYKVIHVPASVKLDEIDKEEVEKSQRDIVRNEEGLQNCTQFIQDFKIILITSKTKYSLINKIWKDFVI